MSNYDSYATAALYNRAMAARHDSAKLHCMDIEIESSIKSLYNGEKYITPAAMSIILDCTCSDLFNALSEHKRAIGKLLLDGNYGNCNYEVHAGDCVKLQGWVNFLSLPCFADSAEAAKAVEIISAAM